MDISDSRIDANPHQHLEEVRRKEVDAISVVLHTFNFFLIGTLGIFHTQKRESWSPSLFVTDPITVRIFIAVLCIYISSSAIVMAFPFPNSDLSEFMNNIVLLFGTLTPISILLSLFQPFGFCILSLWILYFLRDFVTKKSYGKTLGYFWDKVKELFEDLKVKVKVKVKELFKGLKVKVRLLKGLTVKVKDLLKGQVKNEAENAEGLQQAGEQTLQDMKEIIVMTTENEMEKEQNGLL